MSDIARLEREWRHPGLDDLVNRLRGAGFPVGLSETLDAARLLRHLAEGDHPVSDRKSLRARLRPVFCKSSEQQQRFDGVFDAWAGQQLVSVWHDKPAGSGDPTIKPVQVAGAETALSSRLRLMVWLLGLIVLGLAGQAWYQSATKPETASPEQPIVVTPLPQPIEPKPVVTPDPTPRPAQHYGYYPALRYSEALRPAWAWALLAAPLLGLLLLPVLPRRTLSRGKGGQVHLDGWPRATTARLAIARLAPSVVGRLDRHLRGPASELRGYARRPRVDLARTVRATLRRLGVPALRFRHTRLRPTYLLLVDAPHDDDLPMLWAERLRSEGIESELYRLSRDPEGRPHGWISSGAQGVKHLALDALPTPSYGQRLMFVGDGGCLLDEQGQWADWARRARFRRWPERALFTPVEPRHWGQREEILGQGESQSDTGFLVLPQDDNALAAWADLLVSGELPEITLSEAQRYPPLLAQGQERYLEDAPPPLEELGRLLNQLKAYLGENGYYWLSTCAVPPLIDHRLTLLLGAEFLERSGATEHRMPYHVARSYRLLTRLPWLSRGRMPDWLRLALLASLPERIQDEVRRAVEGLLAPQRLNPRGELPLAFEPPPGAKVPRLDKPAEGGRDALYLGFMDGLSAHQLSLRMPGQWHEWLGSLGAPGNRWHQGRAWLSALLARLWYHHGLAHQGPARTRALAAVSLMAVSVAILAACRTFPS